MSKTLDDKNKFVELRAKGYSFSKIADETGVSKPTLIQWSQDGAVSREIHNLRTLHIDELQEKYAMTKRHRITVFGEVLNKAKTELENRDLSDLPTDKLITLVMKLSDTLRQDETELVLMGEPETMPVIDFMETKSWYV